LISILNIMYYISRNNYNGIGLLELMLSLAIIASVLLMATRYFIQANAANKVTETTQIIGTLVNASFKWLEAEPNFENLDLDKLVDAKLLPEDWRNKKDPWGRLIKISHYAGSEDFQTIEVTILGAPKTACENISDIMKKQGMSTGQVCTASSGYIGIYPAPHQDGK
jgi:hypothetical protein